MVLCCVVFSVRCRVFEESEYTSTHDTLHVSFAGMLLKWKMLLNNIKTKQTIEHKTERN